MKLLEWKVAGVDTDKVDTIQQKLQVSRLAAKLLVSRGMDNIHEAQAFLSHDLEMLHDPFLMRDMDRAVKRIHDAINAHEKVTIYGDYDVDGITSSYILCDYLRSQGVDCTYYIPDRLDEGYGVHIDAVHMLCDQGVTLIITVDTGITAVDAVEVAKTRGCDFIITDHHECKDKLPAALAVIDPHRSDCYYPFEFLAGVGVAFKLICALAHSVQEQYIPFVCIGTVADVMPLYDENRAIVYHGLSMIQNTSHIGLRALLCVAGVDGKSVTADTIGYALAPRINAAGRMCSASRVVTLFMEQDAIRAEVMARELSELNKTRQELELKIFNQALEALPEVYDAQFDSAIVLAGEEWHHGVIGIVASRLCAQFACPVILISLDGEKGKGSGRSIGNMNLYTALCNADDILEQYGGHEMAVGLSIRREHVSALRKHINACAKKALFDYVPSLQIDYIVEPEELSVSEIDGLSIMEPYGTANPHAILEMKCAFVREIAPIGKGRHLRLILEKKGVRIGCVYFGKTVKDIGFTVGDIVDVVFCPEVNDFRGRNIQLLIRDIRPCEDVLKPIWKGIVLYRRFCADAELSEVERASLNIEYEEFGAIWRVIKRMDNKVDEGVPIIRFMKEIQVNMRLEKLLIALDIFHELGLIEYKHDGLRLFFAICPKNTKVDLESSKILRSVRRGLMG